MAKRADITGERFGRLTAKSRQPDGKWLCECDCGGRSFVKVAYLRCGNSKSCGCLSRDKVSERNRTHGLTDHPLYQRWAGMLARCRNENHVGYNSYGGRGVKVCERWTASFENFLSDMGEPPSPKHTLERVRTDGHYEPGNCVWATPKQQSRNTTRNVVIEHGGEKYVLRDLEKKLGFSRGVIQRRLELGWPIERAISEAVKPGLSLRHREKKPC